MMQYLVVSSMLLAAAVLQVPHVESGSVEYQTSDSSLLFGNDVPSRTISGRRTSSVTALNATTSLPPLQRGPSQKERELERRARRQRQRERNARAKEALKYMRPDKVEKVTEEELNAMMMKANNNEKDENQPFLRRLGWGSKKTQAIEYLSPGEDYDMWSQAYRMLGGFIDCDHKKDEGGSHDDGDNNDGDGDGKCSRWMMWASYVDPYYQGNEYYEYHGDEPAGNLDCHSPDTEWELLGVYRQEFYQFIEQISKHLWAIDEYEYVVALAGLAYMTDDDCFYVGQANDGSYIYAGVAPKEYGKFEMALYTDDYCLNPNENLGMTFDDFGLYSDVSLQSGDGDGGDDDSYSYAQEWWQDTQEYTLTLLNEVYDEYRYCTSCIDYPTYQDGYFIGDYGTDEDDLINQCWKFYSHDSFSCDADCIALGHSQGTILSLNVGGKLYGETLSSFYSNSDLAAAATPREESKFSKLLANAFVTFSFIVFVATFLAFAVARRSRYRESRSSKSRRLLDDDDDYKSTSRRSRRSKSRAKDKEEGDGLFRTSSRKSRSKSGNRRVKNRSRSQGRDKKADRDRDRDRDSEYDPPKSPSKSRSKRSGSKSRRREHIEDF